MKVKNLILLAGWTCLTLGLTYDLWHPKEEPKVTSNNSLEYIKEYLSKIDNLNKQRTCLKEALYFEARNTSKEEQEAIAEVIINRSKHKDYPNEICKVVKQPKQFSYRNTVPDDRNILPEFQNISSNLDKIAYNQINKLVNSKLNLEGIKPNRVVPEDTLFYHTKSIKPYWAKKKVKLGVDNKFLHVYYRVID